MINLILTCVGGLLTVRATTDGQRVVGGAILAASLASALRQFENRS